MTAATGHHRHRHRHILATMATGLLLATLAACGDDDDTTSPDSEGGDVASSAAFVEEAMEPQTDWPGPDEPVEAVSDKQVFIMSCGAQSEGCVRMTAGMVEAVEELGWEHTVLEPQGEPEELNSAMIRAMDAGADAILWQGFPRAILQDALTRAEEDGVLTVSAQTNEDVPNDVSMDASHEGEILGHFAISDSGGDAKIVMLTDKEFPTLVLIDEAFEEVIATCSDCEILDERDFTVGELTTQVAPETTNLLQRNPDTTHIYTPYDAMGFFAVQGVREAGLTDQIRMFSESGDAANLELIADGEVFVATVAIPEEWIGWAATDQLLRLFNDQDPVPHNLPLRLFTEENVPDDIWEADLDFRAEYRKLWGLE